MAGLQQKKFFRQQEGPKNSLEEAQFEVQRSCAGPPGLKVFFSFEAFLLCFVVLCRVLPRFAVFCRVLPCFVVFGRVWPCFVAFCRVLPGYLLSWLPSCLFGYLAI